MYTLVLLILAAGLIQAICFCNRIWLERLILARMIIDHRLRPQDPLYDEDPIRSRCCAKAR